MNNNENIMKHQLIRLIIQINKVYDNYMCDCGFEDYLIEQFNFELNNIFKDEKLNFELLSYINSLDTRIFMDDYYMIKSLKENKVRKQIVNFIKKENVKKNIVLEYDLVIKYIKQDYRLIKYINNITDLQIISLATINPKVLYLIDEIKENILIEILKNNSGAALILDCDGTKLDNLYYETYLYNKKKEMLKNKVIYELYISGLKEYLENDVLEYSHLSYEARNDIELAEFVLDKDTRLLAYTGEKIRKNKNIMLKMLSLDKDIVHYFDNLLNNN